jgi:2-iminoacetate synthase
MSFYESFNRLKRLPFEQLWSSIREEDVRRALQADTLGERDLAALLSPAAEGLLEEIAQKAHEVTVRHFGRTMLLFTPLYIADFCVNHCVYCSFSAIHDFPRMKLSISEIEEQAKIVAKTGLKHILLLTGESKVHTPVSYIRDAVEMLKKYFSSISIEIYPLEESEYRELYEAGLDGLTVYQEVYDEDIYRQIHLKGPKRNFQYRLDTPERGCRAGLRSVQIGALLGMGEWRTEAFMTAMHGQYLQNKYGGTDISFAIPRMRPHLGSFQPNCEVSDRALVQVMLAYRLFVPRAGISLSTRESPKLRDQLLRLGVTKMSAGVSTQVGGHGEHQGDAAGTPQFEISDPRSVQEVCDMLRRSGYQPVLKDWQLW